MSQEKKNHLVILYSKHTGLVSKFQIIENKTDAEIEDALTKQTSELFIYKKFEVHEDIIKAFQIKPYQTRLEDMRDDILDKLRDVERCVESLDWEMKS